MQTPHTKVRKECKYNTVSDSSGNLATVNRGVNVYEPYIYVPEEEYDPFAEEIYEPQPGEAYYDDPYSDPIPAEIPPPSPAPTIDIIGSNPIVLHLGGRNKARSPTTNGKATYRIM